MRPRRVLYVVSLFPCWSETFIDREVRTLVRAGVDVRILSLRRPFEKLVQPDAAELLPRVRYPRRQPAAVLQRLVASVRHPRALLFAVLRLAARLWRRPLDLSKSLEALARGFEQLEWIREFDPDIIHAHWATYPSTVAWALGRALRRPFGFTCHAHDIFVNDHLLEEKIEAAAVAVTISRFNVEWLTAHVTPGARERLHVIHCGVDLSTLPFRPQGRVPDQIVSVGRLHPIKGLDVMVEAMGLLVRSGRRVRCRIIGEGPEEAKLRAAIVRHGLGDLVELTGALPQVEVREALYRASVLVLPCVVTPRGDRDGIPVALMEAMAAGTPCVSTRVSGIPELVEDEREGLLVVERDAPALARAVARLLDDRELARRLAVAARAKVEREFDAAREARRLKSLFEQANG